MKQKDKVLLIKDLCGRLPYRVKASTKIGTNIIVSFIGDDTIIGEDGDSYDISFITPYLYPIWSMTEEQKQYLKDRFCYEWNGEPYDLWECQIEIGEADEIVDWFNENHIDFRGLIPEGLAKDATQLNIY